MYDIVTCILFVYPLIMEPVQLLTVWSTLHFIETLNKSLIIYFPTELANTDVLIFSIMELHNNNVE